MFMDRKIHYGQDVSSSHLNLIYRFKAMSFKIRTRYLVDIDKLILKFIWRGVDRPRITNAIVKKKNNIRGLTALPELQDFL